MKKWMFLVLLAFAVGLGVMVGKKMSTDAMAVVVGIACGVAASIPTSLLIVAIATRRNDRDRPRRDYPPVVVINPGTGVSAPPRLGAPPMPLGWGDGEEDQGIVVVGDEEQWR